MGPVILRVLPTACRQSFSGGARIPYSKNEILREYLRMTDTLFLRMTAELAQNDNSLFFNFL